MKKYHFTSESNSESIMIQGMIPYDFGTHKDFIQKHRPSFKNGIFLWDEMQTPEEELGSVMWQMLTKDTYKIVQLEVEVEQEDLLWIGGAKVRMYHDQTFHPSDHADKVMHEGVPASVGIRRIPPERIRIVKRYDMMDIVRRPLWKVGRTVRHGVANSTG